MNRDLVLAEIEYLAKWCPNPLAIELSAYLHSPSIQWHQHTVIYDEELHANILDLVKYCKDQDVNRNKMYGHSFTNDSASHEHTNFVHASKLCLLTTGFDPKKADRLKSEKHANELARVKQYYRQKAAEKQRVKDLVWNKERKV